MKEIIFIFLISHAFSVYYIKKHGSVKVSTEDGIVYLNADKFGKNDKIHMQFNAYRSHVDDKIYYEFSDNIPTDTFQPSIGKNQIVLGHHQLVVMKIILKRKKLHIKLIMILKKMFQKNIL